MSSEANTLLKHPSRRSSHWLLKFKQSKHLCLPSRAAILIILWATVVGAAYTLFKDIVAVAILGSRYAHIADVAVLDLIPYVMLTLIMTFYPLSGFIADVCCGRFKTAVVSLTLMLLCFMLLGIVCILAFYAIESNARLTLDHGLEPQYEESIVAIVLLSFALALFIIGLVGFQANYIQLGLDQLLEAPNEYLGLFIHYATWAFICSSMLDVPLLNLFNCISLRKKTELSSLLILPGALLSVMLILYAVTCWKRHKWFLVEYGQSNPYKIVYRVLNFAVKTKYPLRRSAFTYADDYIPSRLDFAKQRYGGPFTTEQVENVKTLLRILIFLVAMGPLFILQLSASRYIFPLFSFHAGIAQSRHFTIGNCSAHKLGTRIVETGGLTALFTNILFPFYIWIIFLILRRNRPKIFTRLGTGVVLSLLGVISMLIIDMVGHSLIGNGTYNTVTPCMFKIYKYNYTLEYNPLNMHWSVFITPSLFLGIGPLLITTTTLEFISAQSPQSMKGLLVGVFFAIQGIFQLIGITAILPVSLTQPWPLTLPSAFSCCSVYLGFILLMGLLGFVLFTFAVKKYKYRERDDILFRQRDVEEVYTRYLIQASDILEDSDDLHENEGDYTTS